MILCIDGNNFLRWCQPVKKGITESQKKSFVRQLAAYQECKPTISEIILVFDAGPFGHATREVHSGIVIMHAGQRSCADRWICEFVGRHKGKEILLVSNDRALNDTVFRLGGKATSCQDFYAFLREALGQGAASLGTIVTGNLVKYHHEGDEDEFFEDRDMVDFLMEQSSRRFTQKDEVGATKDKKRISSGKKLSKLEKKTDKTLKKL